MTNDSRLGDSTRPARLPGGTLGTPLTCSETPHHPNRVEIDTHVPTKLDTAGSGWSTS